MQKKVNDLSATGASCAMIVRALAADNAELDKCDRVTIDSVRTHSAKHFPVQNFAEPTDRETPKHRAKANSVKFIKGVATALTPRRSPRRDGQKLRTLVDSDTKSMSTPASLRRAGCSR